MSDGGVPERILALVEVVEPTGCHIWRGRLDRDGYGVVCADGTQYRAHRYFWTKLRGPIPDKTVLDHLLTDRPRKPGPCTSRACVNPDHLEPVTWKENGKRVKNWRTLLTHCKEGHPIDRVYVESNGKRHRYCSTCKKIQSRDAKKRQRERKRIQSAPTCSRSFGSTETQEAPF
jgi:hypothetical protein